MKKLSSKYRSQTWIAVIGIIALTLTGCAKELAPEPGSEEALTDELDREAQTDAAPETAPSEQNLAEEVLDQGEAPSALAASNEAPLPADTNAASEQTALADQNAPADPNVLAEARTSSEDTPVSKKPRPARKKRMASSAPKETAIAANTETQYTEPVQEIAPPMEESPVSMPNTIPAQAPAVAAAQTVATQTVQSEPPMEPAAVTNENDAARGAASLPEESSPLKPYLIGGAVLLAVGGLAVYIRRKRSSI